MFNHLSSANKMSSINNSNWLPTLLVGHCDASNMSNTMTGQCIFFQRHAPGVRPTVSGLSTQYDISQTYCMGELCYKMFRFITSLDYILNLVSLLYTVQNTSICTV